jgi:hypothetical protein
MRIVPVPWLILLVGLLVAGAARAGQTIYQKPSAFIAEACGGKLPPTKAIRLSSAQQRRIKQLLGREYRPSTVRYWRAGSKLVVILDEIGKTEPITTGFVVTGGRLERVKVLIYRESHGSEVSRTSFTKQFRSAKLRSDGRLDKRVDGIAGATLSVRAVTKLARVALYLAQVALQ